MHFIELHDQFGQNRPINLNTDRQKRMFMRRTDRTERSRHINADNQTIILSVDILSIADHGTFLSINDKAQTH